MSLRVDTLDQAVSLKINPAGEVVVPLDDDLRPSRRSARPSQRRGSFQRQEPPERAVPAETQEAPVSEARVSRAYARRSKAFMGLQLEVGPGAFVPRVETELLGATALEALRELAFGASPRVIDMCCGSGNLACALGMYAAGAQVWASDLTDGAVAMARRNVAQLGLEASVHVAQGDLFASFDGLGLAGTIDLISCNPPYISTHRLENERNTLLVHEPREAFDGGPYGLSIHQRVVTEARAFLRPGGVLLFEIGHRQERQVEMLFRRARTYGDVEMRRDAAGDVRVVFARKL
jgi:release factor glutamine methyltransferase